MGIEPVGYGFFPGFLPNATYAYVLAEVVAQAPVFMVLGIIIILI